MYNPPNVVLSLAAILIIVVSSCSNKSGLAEVDFPQVNNALPADNAENISTNTAISASFNSPMDPSTINNSTFKVFQDTASMSGTVSYADTTATFTPTEDLESNSEIDVTISKRVQDLSGNSMGSDFSWSFTTAGQSEPNFPRIMETNPSANAENIPVNIAVIATFDRPMDAPMINSATFLLQSGSTLISGNVNGSNSTAIFVPSGNLDAETAYTAIIKQGIQDMEGNALGNDYEWSFTTEDNTDTNPPQVSSTYPMANSNDVYIGTTISATFTEEMNAVTLSDTTFNVSAEGNIISGQITYSGVTATFIPTEELENNRTYTASISANSEDLAGNPLASDYQWNFTTEEAPQIVDVTQPTVVGTFPQKKAKDIPLDIAISASFSEPMDPLTFTSTTFIVQTKKGHQQIVGNIIYSGITATFIPNQPLNNKTEYEAIITTVVTDGYGNPLKDDYKWHFETVKDDDD